MATQSATVKPCIDLDAKAAASVVIGHAIALEGANGKVGYASVRSKRRLKNGLVRVYVTGVTWAGKNSRDRRI